MHVMLEIRATGLFSYYRGKVTVPLSHDRDGGSNVYSKDHCRSPATL